MSNVESHLRPATAAFARGSVTRLAVAAATAVSGVIHAQLFVSGYRYIPTIGPAFLLQATGSFAVAALLILGGPRWLYLAAAALSAGALGAFVLSRTVGVAGFTEHGWQPAPQTWIAVGAQALGLLAAAVAMRKPVGCPGRT